MMLRSLFSATVIGMGRRFVQREPLGRPFPPGLIVVGVVVSSNRPSVSKLPADVALHTAEVIMSLHEDIAARNSRCARRV